MPSVSDVIIHCQKQIKKGPPEEKVKLRNMDGKICVMCAFNVYARLDEGNFPLCSVIVSRLGSEGRHGSYLLFSLKCKYDIWVSYLTRKGFLLLLDD